MLYEGVELQVEGRASGMELTPPDKGGIFVDGEFVAEPVARADTPHLVQALDRQGAWVYSEWQDGAAFDDHFVHRGRRRRLRPPGGSARTSLPRPSPSVPPGRSAKAAGVSGAGIALLGAGVGAGVASGVLYVMAGSAAKELDTATTEPDLVIARTKANQLVVASVVAGAVGVGSLGAGIMLLEGGAGVGLTVRF